MPLEHRKSDFIFSSGVLRKAPERRDWTELFGGSNKQHSYYTETYVILLHCLWVSRRAAQLHAIVKMFSFQLRRIVRYQPAAAFQVAHLQFK